MTRTFQGLNTAAVGLLLMASSCQKDELTVVSTATTHTCSKTTFTLNVDSLFDCGPGWPGWPEELHYTICECDTIGFIPVLNSDYEFEHWVIDQGQENVEQHEAVLDTITVESELWLDVEDHEGPEPPHHEHIRILVHTQSCE